MKTQLTSHAGQEATDRKLGPVLIFNEKYALHEVDRFEGVHISCRSFIADGKRGSHYGCIRYADGRFMWLNLNRMVGSVPFDLAQCDPLSFYASIQRESDRLMQDHGLAKACSEAKQSAMNLRTAMVVVKRVNRDSMSVEYVVEHHSYVRFLGEAIVARFDWRGVEVKS